jgi:hypothetical protein
MRISRFISILVCSMPVVFASVAAAQMGGAVGGGMVFSSPVDAGNGNRLPYTATWTNKSVQTLANGTTITHESTARFARDSSGRTYTEAYIIMLPAGQDGQQREMVSYSVYDPMARTTMSWNSNEKRATVTHLPDPQTLAAQRIPSVRDAETSEAPSQPEAIRAAQPAVQHEELGTKNIAGVNATGVRTTRTIPVGREGNDQPMVITDEVWSSKEYGLLVMSVHNDPRYGTRTREVTEFKAGEPDAALFHAPEGYTVHDIPARTVGVQ